LGRGAQVIVLDKDIYRLRRIENLSSKHITTVVANPYTISRGVKFADILITAVKGKGEKSPHLITEEMVKSMKKGAVIVDVSIDQGGAVETSRPTSHSHPVFVKHDVIHYCVPNIPSLVARTASYGLTNSSLEFISEIADSGLGEGLQADKGLYNGVCTYKGYCSNAAIAETFNLEYRKVHIFSKN
jgi:alanine dehydrogenase